MSAHHAVEGAAGNAEALGGEGDVAGDFLQGPPYGPALSLLKLILRGNAGRSRFLVLYQIGGEVRYLDSSRAVGQHQSDVEV